MLLGRSVRCFLAALLLGIAASPLRAHFVWVGLERDDSGAPSARLWFSETAAPGEARLLARVAHSKAWRRSATGEITPLTLSEQTNDVEGAWAAALADDKPCSIEAECIYGIFDRGAGPMMLEYYAKHLHLAAADQLVSLGRAEKVALDVVPSLVDGGKSIDLTVLWRGNPIAGAEVVIAGPQDEDGQLKTDADGRCRFELGDAGLYAVRALMNEPETSGEHEGKPYRGIRRYSTVTLELPIGSAVASAKVSRDANALLAHARDQRAVWDGFPGFTAELTLEDGTHAATGNVTITDDGEVELTGFGQFSLDWVRRQLESMVQHRMSGNGPGGEVEFVAEDAQHPLGPLVRFKDDEEMQSSYRILGDVITQVNRRAGKSRFSINVTDVYRNAAGKYLPTVFQMATWDSESGHLQSSVTCSQTWVELGGFDLPERLTIVHAGDGSNTVQQMLFKGPRLLHQ